MNKYQTLFPRLAALLLDAVLLLPLSILADWLPGTELTELSKSAAAIAISFVNVFYFIILHAVYGQTVGKMLMNVKVLDVTETKLKFWQAFVRDLPQLIFVSASLIPALNQNFGVPEAPITPVAVAVLIWGLADIVVFFATPNRRALHDLIARSVVVRLDPDAARAF
jgi:uncharacterized RDD family membrane protein YckC